MRNLKTGFFLGVRQIQHSNPWASLLIVVVVVFTLLNLVFISGILGGIVDGVIKSVRDEVVGDINIKPLPDEPYILKAEQIINELSRYDQIEGITPRYEDLAIIEANYQDRRNENKERDIIAVNILGVDPAKEKQTLTIPNLVTEGEYFSESDRGYIILGKYNIDRYGAEYGDVFDSLKNVYPGDKVRLFVPNSNESIEFEVKGIIHSKIDVVALNVFIPELDFRRMFDRNPADINEIIIRLKSESDINEVYDLLLKSGYDQYGQVELFKNNVPKFIQDVTSTFESLSLLIGSISVFVASITVFIIIFINIISRRRQIGILKAIGIKRRVIEYAYATQSAFYAVSGILVGVSVIIFALIPYFKSNPIDFPYTFVFLSVTPLSLTIQCMIIFIIMILAGLIPAWLIARQSTLGSILGRN